jgi:tRNA threonylcarbamoyladenosine biosynthesis protein TsaB
MKNSRNHYLFLDTSEPDAVISVYESDNRIATEKWHAHRELSATLSHKYSEIIKEAGLKSDALTGILVFLGPGSFTGLRIGLSFANALAYGLGIPIFEADKDGKFDLNKPKELVIPNYGAEPKITKPKPK